MRRLLSVFSLMFILPLAACFDVEMTMDIVDDNAASGTVVMTASPDFYAMMTSSDEEFCEGEETVLDDGSHICTETFSGTLDEVVNGTDMSDGVTIERRDGGLIFLSFDLGDMTQDIASPEEVGDDEEMLNMMRTAFTGHKIGITVAGSEIFETNGTLSEDGKSARLEIPLETLLDETNDLPASFDVLLKPGS